MSENITLTQDGTLMSLMQAGQKKAFDSIFRKYYQPLCAYAYRFVSFYDVEEIVQDVLLEIWQRRETLDIHISLRAYLYQAVRLRCLNCINSNAVRQRVKDEFRQAHDNFMHTEDHLQIDELILRIKKAIDNLPPKYKEAFLLHRFGDKDMTYKEIAEKLNVSVKTVDYRMQQSLKLLKEELRDCLPLFLFLTGTV